MSLVKNLKVNYGDFRIEIPSWEILDDGAAAGDCRSARRGKQETGHTGSIRGTDGCGNDGAV